MAALFLSFAVCVLYTALVAWSKATALNGTSMNMIVTPSHKTSMTLSVNLSVTPSHNMTMTLLLNTTITPSHNMTMTPSHNMTVTPSHNMTVTPSHNMTVTPSHNMTMTPSHNMTATPSCNMTIMPHNKTVTPSHSVTIMPSSAHTVMPTSSVHPTSPSPQWGNFSVKDKNNKPCLIANMGATFNVMIDSKELKVELPVHASASGECANTTSEAPYITLQWSDTSEGSYNFTMHFGTYGNESEDMHAPSHQRWAATNLNFSLIMKTDASIHTFHSRKEFLKQLSANLSLSYECLTGPTIHLMGVNSSVNVSLSHIEFQPFDVQDGHLSKPEVCPSSRKTTIHPPSGKTTVSPPNKPGSHVVAIAVGCSLAGLVVIVLIGYVIGRRRSRNASAGYRKL